MLSAMLLSSCASPSPTMPPAFDLPTLDTSNLRALFADCVSPIGPTRELPQAGPISDLDGLGVLVPLSTPGAVSDGYYHWLRVHRASGLVHIIQIGGIAGTQTVFGPFNAADGCATMPLREAPPMRVQHAR